VTLYFGSRFKAREPSTDYMEAVVVGDLMGPADEPLPAEAGFGVVVRAFLQA